MKLGIYKHYKGKKYKVLGAFIGVLFLVLLNYIHYFDQQEMNMQGVLESSKKCLCFGKVAELEIYPVRYECEGYKYCELAEGNNNN